MKRKKKKAIPNMEENMEPVFQRQVFLSCHLFSQLNRCRSDPFDETKTWVVLPLLWADWELTF